MTATELVKLEEGCRLHAYPDPATGGKPWTVGWGHCGQGIGPGTVWTQEQADAQLEHDLFAVGLVVDGLVQVPITATERAALMSFAYNEGTSTLSHPACRILNHLNAGDHLTAAGQFMHWTKAGGKPGFLKARRMAEIAVFLSELGVL